MRIDEPVDFEHSAPHVAMLLVATAATRCTAESDVASACLGFACWIVVFVVCWRVRIASQAGRLSTLRPQRAGEAVAAGGMLMFFVTLIDDGVVAALLTLLLALLAAMLLVAQRRAHVLLMLGASLAPVLFAAAQSRTSLFVPCAAWFTLAALSLLTFDIGASRRAAAATSPLQERKRGHGSVVASLLILALALPLYLFVPQPPALSLGGRSALSEHDYGEPMPLSATGTSRRRYDVRTGKRVKTTDTYSNADSSQQPGADAVGSRRDVVADTREDSFGVEQVQRSSALGNGIVMYVRTSYPVYLRGKTYDRFEADRWFRTDASRRRADLNAGYLHVDPPPIGGTLIAQTISVVADLDTSLYASPGVSEIRFPGPTLYEHTDGTFEVPRPLQPETTYSIDAQPELFEGRYAVAAPTADARYLQIDDKLSVRVKELAQSVTAGAADPWTKALALERYMREQYAYSYETIVPYQGRTPLDWFLFEHRRGHCEFFASALAVMLREIGIPSRLATGYALGERNPWTGFYEVKALDGHAWVEAWLPPHGWVMFEPTPFYPLPQQSPTAQVASATDRYLERQADTSAVLVPDSLYAVLARAARDIWAALRNLQQHAAEFGAAVLLWLPALLVLGVLAWLLLRLAVLALQDANERLAIKRLLNCAQREPASAALKLADALGSALATRGAARQVNQTWREYCASLSAEGLPVPADFVEKFEDARYGVDASLLTAQSHRRVAEIVATAMQADRSPRVNRQLRDWREWVVGLMSPAARKDP